MIQYRRADLVGGEVWRLTGLLRGQQGTEASMAAGAAPGGLVVVLDRDLRARASEACRACGERDS